MKKKNLKEQLAALCSSPQGKPKAAAVNALVAVLAGVLCIETRGKEENARWIRFNEVETAMRAHFESYLEQEE